MKEFLNQEFLGNPVKNILIAAGIVLLVHVFRKQIARWIGTIIYKLISRSSLQFDKKKFIELFSAPLKLFLLIFSLLLVLYKLQFPEEFDVEFYDITAKQLLKSVGVIILITSFTWMVLRFIDFLAMLLEQRANNTPEQTDNQLIVFFKDFFKVMLVITGMVLVIRFAFHQSVTSLITGLSIAGAAIALATKESIENLIASFIIFFDKPFVTGDLVKVQNITGTIEKIGLRSTRIRTEQKTYVTVPNKQMVDTIIDNHSLRIQRKAEFRLELNADTKADTIAAFKENIAQLFMNDFAGKTETNAVHFLDMNRDSFLIVIEYFTSPIPMDEFNLLKEQLNFKIIHLMEKMNIKLAGKHSEIIINGSR